MLKTLLLFLLIALIASPSTALVEQRQQLGCRSDSCEWFLNVLNLCAKKEESTTKFYLFSCVCQAPGGYESLLACSQNCALSGLNITQVAQICSYVSAASASSKMTSFRRGQVEEFPSYLPVSSFVIEPYPKTRSVPMTSVSRFPPASTQTPMVSSPSFSTTYFTPLSTVSPTMVTTTMTSIGSRCEGSWILIAIAVLTLLLLWR
ncbi:uncharacterized protein VTP21DRAFT_8737 [Calcarisporiella thermophila]|uniref:uncharacterized protein n=1 Tax=Calcarisporiella thermophila TaxID=911321 RepID=UPI0037447D2A